MKSHKIKTDNRGFTLVEILAAVTILGIISTIAIISVTKVLDRAKQNHYVTAEKNLALAGESYAGQNRAVLPKVVGQKTKISMKKLVDQNYIKQIKDYSKNNCDMEKSYVQIYKYSKTDYSYYAHLECPVYKSGESNNRMEPTITIEAKDDTKIQITIEDENKLMSYSYIIYKGSKEMKNSGNISIPNYNTKVTKSVNLADYSPGAVKVVVTATNIYGNSSTNIYQKNFEDKKAPTCIIEEVDKNDKAWTNSGPIKITVGCADEGSGCVRDSYSKVFKTTTKYGEIVIADEAGNTTKCKVSVFLDTDRPTCSWEGESTTWTKSSRTIEVGCNDKGSGCNTSYSGRTWTYNSGTTKTARLSYTIRDAAGNTTNCSKTANIYVDKEGPTIPSSGSIGNVSGSNTSASIQTPASGSTDSGSGLKEYRYLVTNTSTKPTNLSSFKTSRSYTRSCGTSYYGWAVAVDNLGNFSEIKLLGTTVDGVNSYSAWSSCNVSCGNGTQTRTNSCALITSNLSQSCNAGDCCSSIHFTDGSTCSAACGGGTLNRLAYSDYNGQRCPSKDQPSGGSRCNQQDCCSSTYINGYGEWSSCSASCGDGTKYRNAYKYSTYNNQYCGSTSESAYCNAGSCCSRTHEEYGSWGECSASCGGGTRYRDIYYYSDYDGSYCGTASYQDSESCNTDSCVHTHEYGDYINQRSDNFLNYYETTSSSAFSYSNCSCGNEHTVAVGDTLYRLQCIYCGYQRGTIWCPDSYYLV